MDLGKISQTTEGAYDINKVYERLDTVSFQGSSYLSRIDNNDQPLSNLNAWQISGEKGDDGIAATIEVGTVTTVSSDQDATVENIGTDSEAVLNFSIPKGETGYKTIGAEPINLTSLPPVEEGWYKAIEEGTYPNYGGFTKVSGKMLLIKFTPPSTFVEDVEDIPQATKTIPQFEDLVFPVVNSPSEKIQAVENFILYQLLDGQTSNIGDLPSDNPDIWERVGNYDSEIDAIKEITGFSITDILPTDNWLDQTFDYFMSPIGMVYLDLRNEVTATKNAKSVSVITTVSGTVEIVFINKSTLTVTQTITGNAVADVVTKIPVNFQNENPHYVGIRSTTAAVKVFAQSINSFGRRLSGSTLVLSEYPFAYTVETLDISNTLLERVINLEAETSLEVSDFTMVDWIDVKGQSNALGVGSADPLQAAPYDLQAIDWEEGFSRVFIWNMKTNTFDNLQIGVNNISAWDLYYTNPNDEGGSILTQPPNTFGPEVGIALGWLSTHKHGELYIFKTVGNGMEISYFQKGQPFYTRYLAKKANAEAWLAARGKKALKRASVWVQGESDQFNTQSYYLNALNTMYSDMIEDGFLHPKATKVITQISTDNLMYSTPVADAKDEFIANDPYAISVEYRNGVQFYNGDHIHLNTTGQFYLGVDSFNAIYSIDEITPTNLESKTNWNV